jgi:hypothetical protein
MSRAAPARKARVMTTLHIEHAITDFATWQAAFESFAPLRAAAGVREYAVRRPLDDRHYVVVDLEFDTPAAATSFLETLQTRVWAVSANSPALAGSPQTRVLELVSPTPRRR